MKVCVCVWVGVCSLGRVHCTVTVLFPDYIISYKLSSVQEQEYLILLMVQKAWPDELRLPRPHTEVL